MRNAIAMKSDTTTPAVSADAVTANTICAEIQFSAMGVQRKTDSRKVETDADRAMISVTKFLVDSKTLTKIRSRDNAFRIDVGRVAHVCRALRRGVYLVPIELIDDVDDMVKAYQEERATLVAQFVAEYPTLVDEAKEKLGTLFDAGDYPSADEIRAMFGVRMSFLTFNVPDALKSISRKLYERERDKLSEQMQAAAEEIRAALRESFLGLVEHAADRLTVAEDGKKAKFHDTMIEKMSQFLDLFDKRNITSDEELGKLVKKARSVMSGLDADTLRRDDAIRDRVRESFEGIKDTLDTMVIKKTRGIRFSATSD